MADCHCYLDRPIHWEGVVKDSAVLSHQLIQKTPDTTLLQKGRERKLMPRAEGQTSSVYVARSRLNAEQGISKVSERMFVLCTFALISCVQIAIKRLNSETAPAIFLQEYKSLLKAFGSGHSNIVQTRYISRSA